MIEVRFCFEPFGVLYRVAVPTGVVVAVPTGLVLGLTVRVAPLDAFLACPASNASNYTVVVLSEAFVAFYHGVAYLSK